MCANETSEQACVDVVAAARAVADDEIDLLAAIKVGDTIG